MDSFSIHRFDEEKQIKKLSHVSVGNDEPRGAPFFWILNLLDLASPVNI